MKRDWRVRLGLAAAPAAPDATAGDLTFPRPAGFAEAFPLPRVRLPLAPRDCGSSASAFSARSPGTVPSERVAGGLSRLAEDRVIRAVGPAAGREETE